MIIHSEHSSKEKLKIKVMRQSEGALTKKKWSRKEQESRREGIRKLENTPGDPASEQ
jgi:hypothetical protein